MGSSASSVWIVMGCGFRAIPSGEIDREERLYEEVPSLGD